jgi:myo-inositol-1(or 4)-monophosphatase
MAAWDTIRLAVITGPKGASMTDLLQEYLDFTVETAYLAGRLTLGYFLTDVRADMKADNTFVTVADRKSEELIRQRIESRYPQHAIVGEEYGAKGTEEASHRWFIDPIDGTKAFVCGVPLYAVLIGLEIDGTSQVGAVYFPALDEMIAAAIGHGCWWNGRRARVSQLGELARAIVTFTDPLGFERHNRVDEWARIRHATYYQAGWTDAYGYMLVATGRTHLVLDPVMQAWDAAPFPPILQEAGGYFGDWQGNVTIYGREGLATSKTLLPNVLSVLRGG